MLSGAPPALPGILYSAFHAAYKIKKRRAGIDRARVRRGQPENRVRGHHEPGSVWKPGLRPVPAYV